MNEKLIDVKTMENKVNAINNQIDFFQSKLDKFPKKVNTELKVVVNDLKNKKSKLESQITTYKAATDSAYRDIQAGVQLAWEDLNVAYYSAKERFEKEAS